MKEVSIVEALDGLKNKKKSDITDDYKVYISEIQMEENLTSFL